MLCVIFGVDLCVSSVGRKIVFHIFDQIRILFFFFSTSHISRHCFLISFCAANVWFVLLLCFSVYVVEPPGYGLKAVWMHGVVISWSNGLWCLKSAVPPLLLPLCCHCCLATPVVMIFWWQLMVRSAYLWCQTAPEHFLGVFGVIVEQKHHACA